ncbi:hypothetical protein Tco_0639259, partial [Tanacetum coccineum]
MNVEILEDFTEKLGKGQHKVCKSKRTNIQPNISVRRIKDSLVRFGKYDVVFKWNRVEFEEVGKLFPCDRVECAEKMCEDKGDGGTRLGNRAFTSRPLRFSSKSDRVLIFTI